MANMVKAIVSSVIKGGANAGGTLSTPFRAAKVGQNIGQAIQKQRYSPKPRTSHYKKRF